MLVLNLTANVLIRKNKMMGKENIREKLRNWGKELVGT
jgi:hypothetical protein